MKRFQYKLLSGAMAVMLLVSMFYVGREAAVYVAARNVDREEGKWRVVIDAGHGSGNLRKVTKASKYKKKGNRYPLLHQLLNRA